MYSCMEKNPISDKGIRFLKTLSSEQLKPIKYVFVMTPSDCESCIIKDKEILEIINASNNYSEFMVVSSLAMSRLFVSEYRNIKFHAISEVELQRYGFIGNLGVLYEIGKDETESILYLEQQQNNITLFETILR